MGAIFRLIHSLIHLLMGQVYGSILHGPLLRAMGGVVLYDYLPSIEG
jgi:hypothetical protein